jgi:phosphatidylserine/phosphatidylglycerophosphate/cardiolipin synthase-like enzyme
LLYRYRMRTVTSASLASGTGPRTEAPAGRILEPGRNCSVIAQAPRASVLIDAADYFAILESALNRSVRSIMIVGWDFDARVRLRPGQDRSPELGEFLRALVEAKPDLEIRILVWDLATLYGPGATLPLLVGSQWHDHPRIHLRLDRNHPVYAAQHQKVVCLDGKVAFVGGIDLTVMRWDTSGHTPSDPHRHLPDDLPYVPVHDLQMAVDGDAAQAVCGVAAERWLAATGEQLSNLVCESDPWPEELVPDFRGTPVAIARTASGWAEIEKCREIEALNLDALRSAQETIYIETQYLAESRIVDVLAAHLRNDAGPEVVVLVTRATHGALEKWIMGGNRNRMIRKLRRADRFDRFRVFYPKVRERDAECEILIHSKLVIVDNKFIRIGSSNMNRRSMGLDAECDLAIEAIDDEASEKIVEIRNRLVAEHVGTTSEEVAAAVDREGSLVRAIGKLNVGPRRLESFRDIRNFGPTHLMPGTRFLDPRKPFPFLSLFRSWRRHFHPPV